MSFPRYPEYKESGLERLGLVPAHWDIYSLKRSVEGCVNGIWGDEADGENDLAVIRVADFQRSKLRVGTKKLTYRSITDKEKEARKLRFGDLLIEKSGGGDKTLVGCVVLFEYDFGAVSSNFVARMRPLPAFNSNFLCYAFDSLYKGRVNYPSIKQTTGIQNLDSESYLQERFCFPTLTEQTHIARFLDLETAKIDTLIQEQKRLIELLKEKRQAMISHAVTKGLDPDVPMKDSGVEWLGEVPAHWEASRLNYHVTTRKGVAFKADDFSQEGIPVVKASDIKDKSIRGTSTCISEQFLAIHRKAILRAGDIVLSTVGSHPDVKASAVGQIAKVPSKFSGALLNQNTVIFDVADKQVVREYLFFVLQTSGYRDHLDINAHGTANQVSLNVADMLDFPFLLPPLKEQRLVASQIKAEIDKLKGLNEVVERTHSLLLERRSALISAAVTGKIDVRNWQPPADESTFDEKVRQAEMEVES